MVLTGEAAVSGAQHQHAAGFDHAVCVFAAVADGGVGGYRNGFGCGVEINGDRPLRCGALIADQSGLRRVVMPGERTAANRGLLLSQRASINIVCNR